MKRNVLLLALMPALLLGCYPTRIVTTAPVVTDVPTNYSTVVTIPRTKTTTTTTQVYARGYDISLALDLQAVAAAFAQSNSVREFESLINNASYIISNLDLNNDGYVDYLRVLETIEGRNHVFLIQAVLAMDVYQDVATIVVENPGYYDYHIEIVGAPYIYGPSYIIRPVFVQRPVILPFLCTISYERWHSPWYWGHFPSYYRRPAPVYLNHYQAYVRTFMTNHVYCHEVVYVEKPHYQNYNRVVQSYARNDYERQHPETSFTVRNANVTTGSGSTARRVTNARDITVLNEASKSTSTTTASRSSSATRAGSTATKSTDTSASRTPSTTGTTRSSGSTATTGSSTSSRSASTAGTPSSKSTTSATRSSGNTSGSTTVRSRVSTSGSSDTRTTTVTGSGTTTVRRGSTSSGSTATRSSGSTSATRSSTGTSSSTSASSTTSATRGTRR